MEGCAAFGVQRISMLTRAPQHGALPGRRVSPAAHAISRCGGRVVVHHVDQRLQRIPIRQRSAAFPANGPRRKSRPPPAHCSTCMAAATFQCHRGSIARSREVGPAWHTRLSVVARGRAADGKLDGTDSARPAVAWSVAGDNCTTFPAFPSISSRRMYHLRRSASGTKSGSRFGSCRYAGFPFPFGVRGRSP